MNVRFRLQPYLQNVAVILYFFSYPLVLLLSLNRVANEEQHFDENLVLASSAETLNELCVPVDWVHKVENCISQIRDRTIFKFKFKYFSLALPYLSRLSFLRRQLLAADLIIISNFVCGNLFDADKYCTHVTNPYFGEIPGA